MNAPDGSHSMPAGSVPGAGQVGEPGRPRWLVLGVVGLAQLMIVPASRSSACVNGRAALRC